jgi:hypothetical protein
MYEEKGTIDWESRKRFLFFNEQDNDYCSQCIKDHVLSFVQIYVKNPHSLWKNPGL